jgi:lipopolysaccharide biosynthesis protein
MFWVRPEALRPLRNLQLAAGMPPERGLVDGDLPHALERVLPTSVLVAGYKLADSSAYERMQTQDGMSGARAQPRASSVR